MKITLLLLAIYLTLNFESSEQNEQNKRLANIPKFKIYGGKNGQPYYRIPSSPNPETEVRKGEYVCGNKICLLKPGVEPEGCDGRCQYPLK